MGTGLDFNPGLDPRATTQRYSANSCIQTSVGMLIFGNCTLHVYAFNLFWGEFFSSLDYIVPDSRVSYFVLCIASTAVYA